MNVAERAARFRFVVRDRAGQFSASFDAVLADANIAVEKIPPRCTRANCFAERVVLTVRSEVTNRMLIFGERHLRLVLAEYSAHDNTRRLNRHGLRPGPTLFPTARTDRCISSRPPAALPHPPVRQFDHCDGIDSAAPCTSMSRSHDVTELSAPTGQEPGEAQQAQRGQLLLQPARDRGRVDASGRAVRAAAVVHAGSHRFPLVPFPPQRSDVLAAPRGVSVVLPSRRGPR